MKHIKISLRLKVFLSFFISFFILITVIFMAQYHYFDQWYFDSKVKEIRLELQELQSNLRKSHIEVEGMISKLVDFKELHDVNVSIAAENQSFLENRVPIVSKAIDDDDNIYNLVFIGDEEITETIINDYEVGYEVYTKGYIDNQKLYITLFENFELDNDLVTDKVLSLKKFSGDLEIISVGTKIINSSYMGLDVIETSLDNNLYSIENQEDEVIVGFVESITIDDQMYTIYIEKEMSSIDYSLAIILPFYLSLYFLAVIIAFIITSLLSNYITKPIEEIIDSTTAITNLDFSQTVNYSGNDELGLLAKNINDLSERLSKTMSSLMEQVNDNQLKSKERSHFFTVLSHELKTPLSISRGYIEFLIDGIRQDKTKEYLKILHNENKRMTDITMKMLSVMKYEQKDSIQILKQPLLPLIYEAQRHFDIILSTKQLVVQISGDFEACYFDEKTMINVLINLLSNAVNYASKDSTIKIIGDLESGVQKISIINHATNHAELEIDSIFQKFYSTDTSKNKKTSGTGLGLSIVKAIFEKCDISYNAKVKNELFIFDFYLKLTKEATD